MARAVRFEQYGGIDVLQVVDVDPPRPQAGQLVVRMRAAAINPGEASIREGRMHERFPATFPSGQGTDLAGTVEEVGEGVSAWSPGHEVLGYTHDRASHAELVLVQEANVVAKPPGVSWEAAGSLGVAGTTAYACVRAVAPRTGETIAVSGAAGGVGSIAVQLARHTGATVVGIAGESKHGWLSAHDIVPVAYGDGVQQRIREASGSAPDAFIDTYGGGYVEVALALGIAPERINTIIDFAAAQQHGVKADGSVTATSAEVLAELVGLTDRGELEVPIAATYPLDRVQDAFRELAGGHTLGKIVLVA
jgi:NADPH:quinone reductase-like Zn-dependent oxidoreductase